MNDIKFNNNNNNNNNNSDMVVEDTNFYALPVSKNQYFAIDIGTEDVVDIDAQNKVTARRVDTTHQSFLNFHTLAIPLTVPEHSHVPPDRNTFSAVNPYQSRPVVSSRVYHQYHWYKNNLASFQRSGIKRSLTSSSDGGNSSADWRYCDAFVKQCNRNELQLTQSAKTIFELTQDIPVPLLFSLLDEACMEEFNTGFKANHRLRNCVQCWKENLILCIAGPYNNELKLIELEFSANGMVNHHRLAIVDCCGRIHEVQHSDSIVVVRMLYSVVLFELETVDGGRYRFSKKRDFTFDTEVDAFTLNNPNFFLDSILVVGSKSLSLISIDTGQVEQSLTDVFSDDIQVVPEWQSVSHGSSFNTFLHSWKNDVVMHDLRENPSVAHSYLELPSQYLHRIESLSPVLSWNPLNTHHQYVVTTNQALVICDERYRKTPLTKINHYMSSPPQFLETHVTGRDKRSCLFALGSYKENEIMGVVLKEGVIKDLSLGDVPIKCRSPTQVDGNLSKFSTPDHWQYNIDDWRLAFEKTRQRMSQPSIGFALCQQQSNSNNNNNCNELCLIQETIAGDLLYQKLSVGNFHQDDTADSLNRFEEERCKQWLDAYWKVECTEDARDDGTQYSLLDLQAFLESWEQISSSFSSSSSNSSGSESEEITNQPTPGGVNGANDDKNLTNLDLNKLDLKMDIDDVKPDTDNMKTRTGYINHHSDETVLKKMKTEFDVENDDLNDTKLDLFFGFNGKSEFDQYNYDNGLTQQAGECGVWEKLTQLKSDNVILSRSALRLPPVSSCKIEEKYFARTVSPVQEDTPKPLSQSLVKNWADEMFTPLEHFAPYIAFDEDFGMTTKRKQPKKR